MRSAKDRRKEKARALGRLKKASAAQVKPPAPLGAHNTTPPSIPTSTSTQTAPLHQQGYWHMSDVVSRLERARKARVCIREQFEPSFWSPRVRSQPHKALALPLQVPAVLEGAGDEVNRIPHRVSSVSVSAETSPQQRPTKVPTLPVPSQPANDTDHPSNVAEHPVDIALQHVQSAVEVIRRHIDDCPSDNQRLGVLVPSFKQILDGLKTYSNLQ
jgi:hypothetical protein